PALAGAIAGAIAIAVIAAAVGGVWLVRPHLPAGGRVQSASVLRLAAPARSTAPLLLADRSTPGPTVTPTPSPSRTPPATAAAAGAAGAPAPFGTLPPGSALPGDAQCAAWVRARPFPENKRVNDGFDQAAGHRLGAAFFPTSDDARANTQIGVRVDGAFTGT